MSALADIIEARREEVVQRWADTLFATSTPESIPREQIVNDCGRFLDGLVEGLRTEEGFQRHTHMEDVSAFAKGHGRQRFALGYDLGGMVREFGVLRDVLFQLVEESGVEPSLRELRVLTKYLIGGIADAVSQFAVERDEELRSQAVKHIGYLAHELRNHGTSARLALDSLRKRGRLPDERSTQVLLRSLDRLGSLIDQALVDVRLRAGRELHPETLQLRPFLEELLDEVAPLAEDRGLRVELEAEEGLTLQADPRLLHSALSNLVRNAVKFSEEGGTLAVRAKGGGGRVVLEVEDACGGLPEGRIQGLFDPFVQVGQDRSGFGLGLAIAKQATEAHGGDIRVHDLPGKGCVFVLDLPANPRAPAPTQ